MTYFPIGAKINLEENFSTFENNGFFGWLRNGEDFDPQSIAELEIFSVHSGARSGKYFVKLLRREETQNKGLPERFINSLLCDLVIDRKYGKTNVFMPRPVGLVYSGNWAEMLKGDSKSYFIADLIEGKTLLHIWERLNNEKRRKILGRLSIPLNFFRDEGIYPLDSAPRDIVLKQGEYPVIVDTEHLLINGGGKNKEYLKEQIAQFKEDYGLFLEGNDLEKAVEIVFGAAE